MMHSYFRCLLALELIIRLKESLNHELGITGADAALANMQIRYTTNEALLLLMLTRASIDQMKGLVQSHAGNHVSRHRIGKYVNEVYHKCGIVTHCLFAFESINRAERR